MLEWAFLFSVLILGGLIFKRFQESSNTIESAKRHSTKLAEPKNKAQKAKPKRLVQGALILTEERKKTSSRKVPQLNMEADVVKLHVLETKTDPSVKVASAVQKSGGSQSSKKHKAKSKAPKSEEAPVYAEESDLAKQQAALNARIQKFVLAAGQPKKTAHSNQERSANIKIMERVTQQNAPWSAKAF